MTIQEIKKMERALGKVPTNHDEKCYTLLKNFLKREPTEQEIGNMKTDSNLQVWAMQTI